MHNTRFNMTPRPVTQSAFASLIEDCAMITSHVKRMLDPGFQRNYT
jgi:hypothetical protein